MSLVVGLIETTTTRTYVIALIKKTIFKLITCNVSTSILKLELTIYVIAIVDQMKQFLIQSNVRAKIVCGARSDQKKHIPYQIITALFCRSTKAGLLDPTKESAWSKLPKGVKLHMLCYLVWVFVGY